MTKLFSKAFIQVCIPTIIYEVPVDPPSAAFGSVNLFNLASDLFGTVFQSYAWCQVSFSFSLFSENIWILFSYQILIIKYRELTIITMLFIINRFSDLIHHISESLYPFTKALSIPFYPTA